MQNRENSFYHWGGDTTQMMETKSHLEKLNVNVDIDLSENPKLDDYDLVHIFNIQNPKYGIKQLQNAKKNNKPIVLSTIYWDLNHVYEAKASYLYYLYSNSALVRTVAKLNPNIPYIISKILNFKEKIRDYKIARDMLTEADMILPNSYAELEIIINKFKLPQIREKSLIVYNGISKSKIEAQSLNKLKNFDCNDEYVLEVGTFVPMKGQLKLIEALFDYPEIPLVFVGRGLENQYGKQCIKLGKKRGNTFFVGEIPHKEVYEYYKKAKIHALPSLRESPGLSTLEAAAFGANCVVSIYGPINEYFGFDAFYCEPSNVNSIRNAVLKAWKSPKNSRLKKRILNKFTWEYAAETTLQAYEQVLDKL